MITRIEVRKNLLIIYCFAVKLCVSSPHAIGMPPNLTNRFKGLIYKNNEWESVKISISSGPASL
jgi:hypothetical protein